MADDIPAPYIHDDVVKQDWLDDNGHMNVAYYMTAFDEGGEVFFADPGLGWDYTRQNIGTIFVVSSKVDYYNELLAGQNFRVTSRLLDFNNKMLNVFYQVLDSDMQLCARAEILYMHILFATRRSAPMPDAALARLAEILAAHKRLPLPENLGTGVGIRK